MKSQRPFYNQPFWFPRPIVLLLLFGTLDTVAEVEKCHGIYRGRNDWQCRVEQPYIAVTALPYLKNFLTFTAVLWPQSREDTSFFILSIHYIFLFSCLVLFKDILPLIFFCVISLTLTVYVLPYTHLLYLLPIHKKIPPYIIIHCFALTHYLSFALFSLFLLSPE